MTSHFCDEHNEKIILVNQVLIPRYVVFKNAQFR